MILTRIIEAKIAIIFIAIFVTRNAAQEGISNARFRGNYIPGLPDFRQPFSWFSIDQSTTGTENVCRTRSCVSLSASLMNNMDTSADPCQDFYSFVCGNYIRGTVIPQEHYLISILGEINDIIINRVRLILQEKIFEDDSRVTRMTKNLYKSCMNETLINELGVQPLQDILVKMGGWPVILEESWDELNFSMIESLYKNHDLGFSTGSPFYLTVEIDKLNSSRRRIELDQADLSLPREYLGKGFKDLGVQAYLRYATKAAILLGAKPERAAKEMIEMVSFEIQLAKILSPREQRRNYTRMHYVGSIKELDDLIPQIPWLSFLNYLLPPSAKIDSEEEIIIVERNYLKNLASLLSGVRKRTLENYLKWRVVNEAATYLSEDIRQLEFEFMKTIEGRSQRLPRVMECVQLVLGKLKTGVGNLYIKNFFNKDSKAEIQMIEKYLMHTFEETLKSLDWIYETTRKKALEKSKAIQSHIAYPSELLMDDKLEEHYADLRFDHKSLLENILRFNIWKTNFQRGLLHEKVDKSDWRGQTVVTESNAYFNFQENSIKLPAGVLQGVLYEPRFPYYVKFAGIGMVIGHEITHGFDDMGRQFDAHGNLHNWWDKATEQNFMQRAKCIVDQYSSYVVPELGLRLNSVNTQGEDIADNGGTRGSYLAYQQWVNDNGPEETLPDLPFNQNQLFWIALGQKNCEKIRPEYLKYEVLTGKQTPQRFRLIGPISNIKEFAEDFKCPLGSPMNPVKKCSVWL